MIMQPKTAHFAKSKAPPNPAARRVLKVDYINPDDDPMKAAAAPAPKKDEPKKK